MNFHLLLIVKDVVKECTLQKLSQKSCIGILNTTHMSIVLNKYKYNGCIIIYPPPSHDVNAEAEIIQIS